MAKLTWQDVLGTSPRVFLEANKPDFTLTVFVRPRFHSEFEFKKVYRVAFGMDDGKGGADDYPTPKGKFIINTKKKYPDWMVPNSQWAIDAGLKPGTIVKGGSEANPLKERWLGVTDPQEGVGIHGTAASDSIGSKASHGCIRMLPADVIELFDLVPKGPILNIT